MIAAWMLGSVVLGAVIALGAVALDGAARAAHRTVRWTWAGAISTVVLLTMLLPIRRVSDAGSIGITTVTTVTRGAALPNAGTPLAARALAAARSAMDAPFAQLVRLVARSVSPAANQWLLGGWIVCSIALLALGAYVLRRLLEARRSWPVESLHGESVHVAPSAGPAVMGFVRGAIVVPCWLAECTPEVQQVVLAHEREHLRARDPLLLALGAVAVILLPWNPAVWWMLARLRLAVELDCDRRVIGAGVRARDYGTLLIDLAGRTTGVPLGAPLVGLTMLAERTTHLERRIVAMSTPRPRHAALRIAAGSLVALTAVLAACEAKMPTSVDVDNMTAASAERSATQVGLMNGSDSLRTYYVNGKRVTAAEAHAIASDKIASIGVAERRATGPSDTAGAPRKFRVTIPDGVNILPDSAAAKGQIVWIETRDAPAPQFERKVTLADSRFAGLVFIDGKRSNGAAMTQINPADIASIEVLKGARAAALYPNDPAAAQGVIQITTKQGAH